MICNNCQTQNPDNMNLCLNCGAALHHACPDCGHTNPEGMNFCMNCGAPLQYSCPNCGQANPADMKFCANCGSALFQSSSPPPKTRKAEIRTITWLVGWFAVSFVITYLTLNVWGILQTLSPITGTKTEEAEALAVDFVAEYYPQLVDADRTVYTANVQGTDYYVVDFILKDPAKPPMGVRILVDRLLRAVFAYEYIQGEP